jgi:hypothetical protein
MPQRLSHRVSLLFCLIVTGGLRGDSRPAGKHPDVPRLPEAAAQLYADTTLFPRPTKWLEVPWLLDLNVAIRLAKSENRPVLIWVSGDDPLERC